ncbi:MAG: YcbK family protein [Limnobacter sp.]|uniref:YcbK family protein n=1 Tax=Limnobacter sp. TaxID=2003368 RepID=UPI00391ABDCC
MSDNCNSRFNNRRSFLQAVSTLAMVGVSDTLIGQGVQAATRELAPPPDLFDASLVDMEFWLQPRTLNMVRPQSGDRLKITYWQDGHINPKAYQEICSVLRDVQANLVYRMDTRLIDTLWAAQAFVQRYGFSAPIEITSGYRSPKTNRRLIEQGLPAARNSLHMRGQAADFRMPGLHPSVLGELVQGFKAGGVGFYFRIGTQGGWIHADTGPEREWRG